jgi:hypothetical protein
LQLYRGYETREKLSAIHRAELLVTIVNSNRWDDKQKVIDVGDVLPWYDDYIAGNETDLTRGQPEYVAPIRETDESVPQLERITKRLLEDKGLDDVEKGSPEWLAAEETAKKCLTGGAGEYVESKKSEIAFKKADPAEWGEKPPWDDED